jgi:hypothetical protein
MPTEIHSYVLDHLEYVDALCLAHTCRYFWVIGLRRLIHIGSGLVASWAGDRLICIGNYAESPPPTVELPSDILNALNQDHKLGLYDFTRKKFQEIYCQVLPQLDYFELKKTSDTAAHQLDACISAADAFGPKSRVTYELHRWSRYVSTSVLRKDSGRVWVLRNLDTSEYIRLNGITWYVRHGEAIDLLSALLYRTAWSTTDHTGSNHRGLHQGPWVGHRFDVTPLHRIPADERMAWKDITAEVKEELYNIAVSDGKPWAKAYKRCGDSDL